VKERQGPLHERTKCDLSVKSDLRHFSALPGRRDDVRAFGLSARFRVVDFTHRNWDPWQLGHDQHGELGRKFLGECQSGF